MDFKNQVVLVTGGTRGIGRGIVHAFAKEGACIAVNGTKKQLCSAVVEEVREYGGQGIAVPGDISKSEDVQKVFAQIFEQIGHLDILVNNAGVIYVVECTDTTDEQWDHTMNVNCRGVFLCSREAARHMKKRKSGKIINVSSQLGKTGVARYTHYCASKFAVVGFTQALAMELALHGVNVNAVCPGIVDTDMMKEELVVLEKLEGKSEKELRRLFLDMIPLGRYESTDDIASLVLFLASEKAQYITGQSINVSGGIEFH
jgi:NAD(P)-dependent dehydrogenase (short-subunit alcohol dehydrogenase family)